MTLKRRQEIKKRANAQWKSEWKETKADMQKLAEQYANAVLSDFGNKVKELRKKNGYTLEDVADMTGVSISMISTVERGQAKFSLESLMRWCHAMEIEPQKFFKN